jgi:hypothetical protein
MIYETKQRSKEEIEYHAYYRNNSIIIVCTCQILGIFAFSPFALTYVPLLTIS